MHQTLQQDKLEDADFKYDKKKIQISGIFGPKLKEFFLHQTLQQEKLEDTNFKYDNSIFKSQPKYTQIRHFWTHS